MPHSVFIVDDHPAVRRLLESLLARQPDFTVAGSAADGVGAVAQVLKLRPDVVVMDISMPVMNGIEAARELLAQWPEAKIVFLSMHTTTDYVRHAFDAGARGYVIKDAGAQEIVHAIRSVMAGALYLSEKIAALVPDILARNPRDNAENGAAD